MTLILFVYVPDTACAVPCCIAYGVGIVSFIHFLWSVWRCLVLMNADKSSRLSFVYPYADFGGLAGILIVSMKLKTWLLMPLIAAGITACEYDDSALKADVDNLKDRITALEEQVNHMNEDIVSLQDIIRSLDQQIGIAGVEENTDGYTLHFTDGTTVSLHNGKDGADGTDAPVIGTAEENGIAYWTLTANGQTDWLTDEAGNRLPVTGTSGITPLLSIDKEGYWTVSYDGGNTYAQITGPEGKPIQATGKDGTSGSDGADGKDAPVIGIAQENGIYYWTLTTGEETTWLTDEAGNKLPVTGASGITPLLSIDDEGYWTVSYDGGNTYTQITDTQGNPVQAVGKDGADGEDGTDGTPGTPGSDGDSFFQSVTQDSEKVILVLTDGTVIHLPKAKAFGISFAQTENIPLDEDGVTLPYTITGADADTQVRAFVSKGNLEVTLSEGSIFVKPQSDASVDGSEVIVLLFNKEKTITTLLTFTDAPQDINADGSTEDYEVEEGTWDE
ncbi:PL29 family lyase N-terminal domain-containing protein [Bacteroides gallinaceum]|uniref:PL29 family lyase N-terminal domain-containing protein n=1 Tax=Bacteroides gallinaceum TaxID=1462571 RepID=A0ABT7X154_9BACE|nr:PL29 family lyase N-terminal domain-containing protein [Bacteroides gallinaceum]MDN0047813.1 PL29 family lyase N-terminal domain-containing protein [Bacteroides gallinaceum]